jgi:predicted aspartyl protease
MAIFSLGLTPAVAASECSVSRLADLPVTMDNGMPTIPVTINGIGGTFLLDSGAFYTILSYNFAKKTMLAVRPVANDDLIGGVGGLEGVRIAKAAEFKIAQFEIPGITLLSRESDGEKDGFIGQNILSFGDAEFDLAHNRVSLYRVKGCYGKMMAYWAGDASVSELELESITIRKNVNKHIIGSVVVNGVKLRAIFDTGASYSILTRSAARFAGLRTESADGKRYGGGDSVGGDSVTLWEVSVSSIQIGDETLRNNKVLVGDMADVGVDMIIGMDFLRRHRLFVSYSQNKMYFTYLGGAVFLGPGTSTPSATK